MLWKFKLHQYVDRICYHTTYVATVCVLVEKIETQSEESSEGQENQDGGQQTENERTNFNIDDMLILQSCFDGRLLQTCLVYLMLIDLFVCFQFVAIYYILFLQFNYIYCYTTF